MNEFRSSLTRTESRLTVDGELRRLSGVAPGTVCHGIVQCAGFSPAIQLEAGSTQLWRLMMWKPFFDNTDYVYVYSGVDWPSYNPGYYDFQYDYALLNRQYTGKDLMWAVIPDPGSFPTFNYVSQTLWPTCTVGNKGLFIATDMKPNMNKVGTVYLPTPVYGDDLIDYEIGSTVWAFSPGL